MKKKIVSISLDTGKVTATRYEDISEESRTLLSALQKIRCEKLFENVKEDIIAARMKELEQIEIERYES